MRFLLIAVMTCALAASPSLANAGQAPSGARFSQQDIQVITDLVGTLLGPAGDDIQDQGKAKGKKPGKGTATGRAKDGKLPPGLQKRLDRGEPLPPGLSGRPLPPGLTARLGPAVPGTERLIAGTDVVLIEKATGIVLDIVRDVLKGTSK